MSRRLLGHAELEKHNEKTLEFINKELCGLLASNWGSNKNKKFVAFTFNCFLQG